MTDTISLFRAFVRVVEAGSFTRVAQEQNSSQPTVSRQVAALEEHLGTRLFTRTTRKLTLTDDGRGFYERAGELYHHVRGTPVRLLCWEKQKDGTYKINWPLTMRGVSEKQPTR